MGGFVIIDHFQKELFNIDDIAYEISKTGKLGDNIAGGLSTSEEKSIGGAKKSGSAPIQDVIGYAEVIDKEPRVYMMYTPGHGAEVI